MFGLVVSSKDSSSILQNGIGAGYAESLFFDVLLNYGLVGLIGFLTLFFIMWISIIIRGDRQNPERVALILFMPGFFIANALAGSSFLTDFILPIFLIMFVLGLKRNG